jgi:class 3 adenylate cyclase
MFSKVFQNELFKKFTRNSASEKILKFGQKGPSSESKKILSRLDDVSYKKSFSKPMTEVVGEGKDSLKAKNESLDGNKQFRDYAQIIKNRKANAYVAFVDICNFSSTIKDKSVEEVQSYLKGYYERIFKVIKDFDGQIDKIMGDGIVVVFSDVFGIPYKKTAGKMCLDFSKKCVENFYDTEYAVKVAIGSGELFFAETGTENTYEECCCIGHPMTVAFRLEDKADANQILILEDDDANDDEVCSLAWTFGPLGYYDLKGLDPVEVRIYYFTPEQQKAGDNL